MRPLGRCSYILLSLVGILAVGAFNDVRAASMTSSNYTILNDSQNCGGGKSTSTNYILFDSLCENAAGEQISASTVLDAGLQAGKDKPFIDATLSGNALAFGTLSPSSVSTSDITLTVSTNGGGYTADIMTDGALRTSGGDAFTDASASDTIFAGSGKYGIRTSGDDGQYNSADTGIGTTAKTFASRSSSVGGSVTTVTFKAAPSALTDAGQYSQAITIIVAGTF